MGYQPRQVEFKCKNPECHVSAFLADINASAKIAHHVDPWGESLPVKQEAMTRHRTGAVVKRPRLTVRRTRRPRRWPSQRFESQNPLPAFTRQSLVSQPEPLVLVMMTDRHSHRVWEAPPLPRGGYHCCPC
nr:hypothetical protein [Halonotius terrestris]